MQKTVQVVDEAGNRYEATYLKRAQGLVKKGRARFIDENTILLVCPPKQTDLFSEEQTMENTIKHTDTIETRTPEPTKSAFILPETDDPAYNRSAREYNINYCLQKIDEIGKSIESVNAALVTIASIDSEATPAGGSADEQAKAVADVIRCRETTNQKLIDFYRDMIDRFLPPKKEDDRASERRHQYLDWIKSVIEDNGWTLKPEDLIKLYREFQ